MRHRELLALIITFATSSLVFGISSPKLQQSTLSPSSSSLLLSLQSAFVFAQSMDEPVLRFSDEIGNPVFNLPGFTSEVVAEGLALPTTMAFLSPPILDNEDQVDTEAPDLSEQDDGDDQDNQYDGDGDGD